MSRPTTSVNSTNGINTEHIPALGSVPSHLVRPAFIAAPAAHRAYVALYHLTSPEVVRSAEWKKAADTPWTQKNAPAYFRDHLRIEWPPLQPAPGSRNYGIRLRGEIGPNGGVCALDQV